MLERIKRVCVLGASMACVGLHAGCGGSDGPTTPTVTQPPAPVTTTLFSAGTSIPAVEAGQVAYGYQDIGVPYAGTVTAAFDWTVAANNIDIVVTQPDCTDVVGAYTGTCTVLGADLSPTRKPATVTFNMASTGTIRVWLFSFSRDIESGVLNVTILH